MMDIRRGLAICWLVSGLAAPALAADKLRIGFLATASGGPTIGPSKEVRAGFDLGLKLLDGKVGGVPVEVVTGDDQGNPDVGKQALDRMIKRDKVDLVTGVVSSGVIFAVAPLATQQQVFFLNSNVGSRELVAEKCSPFYFNTGWNIESVNEAMGKYIASQGYKKVYVIGAGVPVGREHIEAFKRGFGAPVVGEAYYKPQTLDFSAEMAQIRAAQPDAVYAFTFGPISVNFTKQYAQAGLKTIPLFGPAPLADEENIPAGGEAMVGVVTGGHWHLDLAGEPNKRFVAAFQKEYGRAPSLAAEQGFTTVLILDAAVKAAGGKTEDKLAFRKALEAVNMETPRGAVRFNADHSPVQNTYLRKVLKTDKGEFVNRTQKMIAAGQPSRSASACQM